MAPVGYMPTQQRQGAQGSGSVGASIALGAQSYQAAQLPVTASVDPTATTSIQPTTSIQLGAAQPISINSGVGMQNQSIPTQNQQIPQTGLIGSEKAINNGAANANRMLDTYGAQANNIIDAGTNNVLGAYNQGATSANNYLNKGYSDAGERLAEYRKAMNNSNDLQQGITGFDTSVDGGIKDPLNAGAANFSGNIANGNNANKLQADLSGANGLDAQKAAYAAYQSSPAMQYQMDQMQKATERSAAARGNLLGGNVLQELQRNASGIASQDYQNQFNNIGTVANTGLQAAGQVAGLKQAEAGIAGNLKSAGIAASAQQASQILSGENQRFMQREDIRAKIADKLSSLAESAGINQSNISSSLADRSGGVIGSATNAIANNIYNTGINKAGIATGSATQLSNGRTNAGIAIANNVSNTASSIGNLLAKQGIDVSGAMGDDVNNISNMIHNSGLADSVDNNQLATILANIAGGQATNQVQTNTAIGSAKAAGTMGVGNAIYNGVNDGISLGIKGGLIK